MARILYITPLLVVLFCAITFTAPQNAHAASGSVCFADGCVYFAQDNGSWLNWARQQPTAAATMNFLYTVIVTNYGYAGNTFGAWNGSYYGQLGCYNGVVATTIAPPAPTGLYAMCSASGSTVTLYWSGNSYAQSYPLRVDDPNTYTGSNCSNSTVNGPGRWCPPPTDYAYDSAYSGISLTVQPGVNYGWWVHGLNPIGWSPAAISYFRCTAPMPTCSLSSNYQSINAGTSAQLSWSTTNATVLYISSIGYVSSAGGYTFVSPSVTTTYTGTAAGPSGSQTCSRTITVIQPQSCTFNGSTVAHGQSVTAYQSSSVPNGYSCVSQTRTCNNGTLSGSYTYPSCTVIAPPANCTLDGVVVPHGTSRTFYSSLIAPTGSVCSAVSQSRTCTNGTLSGNSTYQYASCSCAPLYFCSAGNVQHTNSSCVTSTVDTCTAPSLCSPGQSACVDPNPTISTHLEVRPAVVRRDDTVKLYWDVGNVEGCTVTGTNGNSWTDITSGINGQTTFPITERTVFTLTCTPLEGSLSPSFSETATVIILPVFQEQ